MSSELFLDDTFKFTHQADVLSLGRDELGSYIVLDETIFYPQGGGQPSDTGSVVAAGELYPIAQVRRHGTEIRHYCAKEPLGLLPSLRVAMAIEPGKRLQHAAAHTCGHLIQALTETCEPGLQAVKGYHDPVGSYVEFQGEVAELEALKLELNKRLTTLWATGPRASVKVRHSTPEELAPRWAKLLPPHLVGPVRTVEIEGFAAIPCGGTHLSYLAQVRTLAVEKLKKVKGQLRVSYRFTLQEDL